MTRLCEKSNNTGGGNTESLGKLSRQKQALQRERDNLIEESQKLRADKERAEEYIIELETTSAESRQTNTQLKQEIQTRQNDLALQGTDYSTNITLFTEKFSVSWNFTYPIKERQKELTEKELKHTIAECEEKTLEIRSLLSHLAKKKDENSLLAGQVKDLKTAAERSIKENRLLETRFNRLQGEYQSQADVADQLATDVQKKVSELKSRDDEIGRLRQEMGRLKAGMII